MTGNVASAGIGVKKSDDPFGLLKRLDEAVQKDPVKTAIAENGCYPDDVRKTRSWRASLDLKPSE